MKKFSYVLSSVIVVLSLLFVSCEDNESAPSSEGVAAFYRPYDTNANQNFEQGIYVNMGDGRQYKFGEFYYESTSFEIEQIHSDTSKITIEGVVELCTKTTDFDPIPYGKYKIQADQNLPINYDRDDEFNLNGIIVVISNEGVTFDGNPSKDLLYRLEYKHEGVDYLIRKGKDNFGYYNLQFVKKGSTANSSIILIKQD